MIALNEKPAVKHNFKLAKTDSFKNYITQFESAVKNFEQIAEEETQLKNKAVHMRLASYFQ